MQLLLSRPNDFWLTDDKTLAGSRGATLHARKKHTIAIIKLWRRQKKVSPHFHVSQEKPARNLLQRKKMWKRGTRRWILLIRFSNDRCPDECVKKGPTFKAADPSFQPDFICNDISIIRRATGAAKFYSIFCFALSLSSRIPTETFFPTVIARSLPPQRSSVSQDKSDA